MLCFDSEKIGLKFLEKAMEMGKTSATGSFQLFIGKMVSSVILAVGTIIVGIFISPSDYGLYAIALVPSATILLFQDWGVGSALIKYCAQYRAENKVGEMRRIIVAGLTFESVTGLILLTFSLIIANFVASAIFNKPESAFLIAIASAIVLSGGVLAASQSVFVGFERMGLSSLTTIFQAIVQGLLMPLLVYLGYGAVGAVIGYTSSLVVASVIALGLVYFMIFRKLPPGNVAKSSIFQNLKPLVSYGVPLAIANILAGILPQFYSFIMASLVDTVAIGNYRIALNFAVLLTFFTIPISTALFPVFSKLDAQKEPHLLKTVFASSVKYTSLLIVPATLAMIVLSQTLIGTIYGSKWPSSPAFLSLYVVINLFAIFGNLSLGSLLSGLGETRLLMKLSLLTLLIGVPMSLLFIPQFGIFGVIMVNLFAGIPSLFVGLHWISKHYQTKVDFRSSAKILLASSLAAVSTYLFVSILNVADWLLLTIGAIIFLAIYVTTAPIVGAINQADINNLRAMTSRLGFISRILEVPLRIIQRILDIRNHATNNLL